MNALVAKLALDWLRAEHNAPAVDAELEGRDRSVVEQIRAQTANMVWTDEAIAMASSRVYDVLRGEVRWSETTPGDRAIWKGRLRDVGKFESWYRTGQGEEPPLGQAADPDWAPSRAFDPRSVSGEQRMRRGSASNYRQRQWGNYYDTHTVKQSHESWTRLFGHTNVGNIFRSNLASPGQLGYGETSFLVFGIYMTVSHLDALRYIADQMVGQFVVGNSPMTPKIFGRDLFLGVSFARGGARPILVPLRQNVSFPLDFKSELPADMEPFDLTVHIDGLETRDV